MYIKLQTKYYGAFLFDNETRATQKLFRVATIQFVRSFSQNRHSCWEATCEPVYRGSAFGEFIVPHEDKVEGLNVLLAIAQQGYALCEYPDGIETEAVHFVRIYIKVYRILNVLLRYTG